MNENCGENELDLFVRYESHVSGIVVDIIIVFIIVKILLNFQIAQINHSMYFMIFYAFVLKIILVTV